MPDSPYPPGQDEFAAPSSIRTAAASIRAGQLTSTELVTGMLRNADKWDDSVGAYAQRFDETALAAARKADQELQAGIDRGPLHGIPIGIKDILAAREGPTLANSTLLDSGWWLGKDAPAVGRLRSAGAVIIGKTTTAEFACGTPDPAKPFRMPRNPWDTRTYPGASSSGSAAGVAAEFFLGAVGTDTGGSIRIPAAWCGITGLKPTFGRIPKSGCIPVGYSLDHVGPLARSAWDCAVMLTFLAGSERTDPDSSTAPAGEFQSRLPTNLAGTRIGVDAGHYLSEETDPAVGDRLDEVLGVLESLGAHIQPVSLPYWEELGLANRLILVSEAASYHSRNLRDRPGELSASTRRLLATSAFVTACDYVQAQRLRRAAQLALRPVFSAVDVILSPTAGTGAVPYGDDGNPPSLDRVAGTWFGWYWNAVGYPALAVPMGFSAGGLPLSVQFAGRPFEEATVLAAGHAYQSVTDWHEARAPLCKRTTRMEESNLEFRT